MSGHGTNTIFFDKKKKIGRSEHLVNPYLLRPISTHFCLIPPPLLKEEVICVSPLILENHNRITPNRTITLLRFDDLVLNRFQRI